MTLPSNTEFFRMANRLNGMVGELDKAIRPIRPLLKASNVEKKLVRDLTDVSKRARYFESEMRFVKDQTKRANVAVQTVKKEAEAVKKVTETIKKEAKGFKKIIDFLKNGSLKKINPGWGGVVGLLAQAANTGMILYATKVNEEIQEINLRKETITQSELDANISRIGRIFNRIKATEKDIKIIKDNVDRMYAESASAAKNSTYAREKANNALYEVRVGRAKLEAQIKENAAYVSNSIKTFQKRIVELTELFGLSKKQSNDALYEARQGRVKVDAQIKQLQQSKINSDNQIKQLKSSSDNEINKLKTQFDKLFETTGKGTKDSIASTLAKISNEIDAAKKQATIAGDRAGLLEKTLGIAQKTIDGLGNTLRSSNNVIDSLKNEIAQLKARIKDYQDKLETVNQKTQKTEAKVEQQKFEFSTELKKRETSFEQSGKEFYNQIEKQKEELKAFKKEVTLLKVTEEVKKTTTEIDKLKKDVGELLKKSKEIDEMDRQANDKLNRLIGSVATIPPLIRNISNDVKQAIPSQEQLKNAAAAGTCETFKPGGCGSKALNDNANQINNNTNNKVNNALDALNTGANAAQLAALGVIDAKLGAQLPGGLSGTFGRLWQTLQIDRVLNVLILISTFHNALMLSNNIAQTLFGAIDNISQTIGFKWKNEKGEEVGFGSIVSEWTANFFKALFGEANYNGMVETYKKANRIYQATANLLNTLQGLHNTVINALEVGFGWVGKIGNALRMWGQVGESAYQFMNPQPNFNNRFITGLQAVEQGASTVNQITGEVLSFKEQIDELGDAKKELDESLSQKEGTTQGTQRPEAEKVKGEYEKSKTASAAPAITDSLDRKAADE